MFIIDYSKHDNGKPETLLPWTSYQMQKRDSQCHKQLTILTKLLRLLAASELQHHQYSALGKWKTITCPRYILNLFFGS